jgi:hypothetical protein
MSGPGDEQKPPDWQQPQWQQPQQPSEQPQWGQQPPQQPWGQQPPAQQPWGGQPQWQQPPATPGVATAALILGICGILFSFCFIGIPCAIVAVILGYKARNQIDASGGRLGGRGLAIAGLVMGWIGVAINALFIVLVIIGAVSSPS